MSKLPAPVYDIEYFSVTKPLDGCPPDLVSVIVASYNYEQFVVETLASVAAQTYRSIELIVVDDQSPDRSLDVVRRWMQQHGDRFVRVVLARPAHNQGLAESRNAAVRLSAGSRVFVLDADNVLFPTCLERHAEVIDRTGAELAYSAFEWFGADKRIGMADFWDRDMLKHGNYIDAMAMFSKRAWEAVGGYSYFDVMGWEDYDLWCKFVERGYRGIFIPEVLCGYRVHATSMTFLEIMPKTTRLSIEMTARHPWLDLEVTS